MASKKLSRSQSNKMLGGVCGGAGDYFNVDPTWIRILYVALTLLSGGIMLLIYGLLWLIIPDEGSQDLGGSETLSSNADEVIETTSAAIESGAEKASSLGNDVSEAVSSAVSKATEGSDESA